MQKTQLIIKTISTLDLRKNFGELTNQVLYSNTALKVTKNKNKTFIILPLKYYEEENVQCSKSSESQNLINDFRKTREKLNKKDLKINNLTWSEFIKKDRHSH